MPDIEKFAATSVVTRIRITNNSGNGMTGLTTASTGMVLATIADTEASATLYTSNATTLQAITTLGTYSAPTAGKARFAEVDSTNLPGVYEIQLADARWAITSAQKLIVGVSGVTNMIAVAKEVQLTRFDLQNATTSVYTIGQSGTNSILTITAGTNGGGVIADSAGRSVTLPANNASLGIGATGHILNVDTVTSLTNLPAITSGTITLVTLTTSVTNPVTTVPATAGTLTLVQTVQTVTSLTNLPSITSGTITLVNTTTAVTNPVTTVPATAGTLTLVQTVQTVTSLTNLPAITSGTITLVNTTTAVTNPVNASGPIYQLLRALTVATDSTALTAHALALGPAGGGSGSGSDTGSAYAVWNFILGNATVQNSAASVLLGLASSSGTGAYTISQPVTDGTSPLQNVAVWLTLNSIPYKAVTDANGNAEFNLDAGTYTRAAVYPGYLFNGDSEAIAGNGTLSTIIMALEVHTDPIPGANQVNYSGYSRDTYGTILPAAKVWIKKVAGPLGVGSGFDSSELYVTSGTDGYFVMAVQIGGGYQLKVNSNPYSDTEYVNNADGQWRDFG